MTRKDGRAYDALRPITIETGFQRNPEGSVLYRAGGTTVLVSASVSEGAPDWMRSEKKTGWVTAEYLMHPRSTEERQRGKRGSADGRATEIQRLVARSLRAAVDLSRLGPRTITIDCDVLDADGGTRTASITGGMIALALAIDGLRRRGLVERGVLRTPIAAISVGLVGGSPMLDLCYEEDRDAEVDLNFVGTEGGAVVEVQGTAEGAPIPRAKLDAMLDVALGAIPMLVSRQRETLEKAGVPLDRLFA